MSVHTQFFLIISCLWPALAVPDDPIEYPVKFLNKTHAQTKYDPKTDKPYGLGFPNYIKDTDSRLAYVKEVNENSGDNENSKIPENSGDTILVLTNWSTNSGIQGKQYWY